jgi:hypothetical protein
LNQKVKDKSFYSLESFIFRFPEMAGSHKISDFNSAHAFFGGTDFRKSLFLIKIEEIV